MSTTAGQPKTYSAGENIAWREPLEFSLLENGLFLQKNNPFLPRNDTFFRKRTSIFCKRISFFYKTVKAKISFPTMFSLAERYVQRSLTEIMSIPRWITCPASEISYCSSGAEKFKEENRRKEKTRPCLTELGAVATTDGATAPL